MTSLQSQLADRQRQWRQMSAAQQMHRVQSAIVGTLDYARWRRQEARRRTAARLAQQPEKGAEILDAAAKWLDRKGECEHEV